MVLYRLHVVGCLTLALTLVNIAAGQSPLHAPRPANTQPPVGALGPAERLPPTHFQPAQPFHAHELPGQTLPMPTAPTQLAPGQELGQQIGPHVGQGVQPASFETGPGYHPYDPYFWPYRIPSYDDAIGVKLLDPVDPHSHPYSLNFTGNIESRYFGFLRSEESTTDAAGNLQEIRDLNLFEIARWWGQFYGYVGDPNIIYSFNIFGSSTQSPTVSLNGAVGYKFCDALTLSMGVDKVPGGREWQESYRWHFGVDRSMATTFFRPAISPGLFASGQLTESLSYRAAIVNDGNGAAFNGTRPGENLAWVFSPVWEPLGDFGPGFSDLEYHDTLVTRIGGTIIGGANSPAAEAISGNPENTLLRLSDGTPLATMGALGPGVTVVSTDAIMGAIDLSAKVRGASIGFEYFWRQLDDFKTTGGAPSLTALNQNGGYLYMGYFVCPHAVEVYARGGLVDGEFGNGKEYGGGVNLFLTGSRKQRAVFEVLRYQDNPADNGITPYRAFYSGTAIQFEYQIVL